LVATTVVDSNTNGTGFLATDTSFLIKKGLLVPAYYFLPKLIYYLEFLKSETTARSQLHVVAESRATDSRTEETVNGSGGDLGSLLDTCESSGLLATGLIEPGLNTKVPFFAEVLVRQLVVMLQNH
jgi:hypothetical protein